MTTIPRRPHSHPSAATPLLLAALALPVLWLPLVRSRAASRAPRVSTIVLNPDVRDSMNAIWTRSNQHWNELAGENTLTQMLGTGKPTQHEYLGCMSGAVVHDTLIITGTEPARDMRQLQFAVTGTCIGIPSYVGAWHTHPYRADPSGAPLKERGLSAQDLDTFAHGDDPAVLVVWDVDSLDAAARRWDSTVRHPVPVIVR